MPNLYALLIGIDFYFPHSTPEGTYNSLGGCVRDVDEAEAYLRQWLDVAPEQIIKLTATRTGGTQPAEPPAQWPTYANMVAGFQRVARLARPGDQVYLHYAGYGAQVPTAFPDLKGGSSVDEVWVPTDIGTPETRYLRDVELHWWCKELVEGGVLLTVVIDSGFVGTRTRGAMVGGSGAVARGVPWINAAPRPSDSLLAPPDALYAAWNEATGGRGRAVKPASGWLPEPKGYTLLAACRANESAYECTYAGRERHGALTYWLLDTLRQMGVDARITYRMLHRRVLAKVRSQLETQTPMLQGEAERLVFGAEQRTASSAKMVQPPVPMAETMPLPAPRLPLQRGVVVAVDDPVLHQRLEQGIQQEGGGFLALSDDLTPPEFQVFRNAWGELEIQDPSDQSLPNQGSPLRGDDPSAVGRLVRRLVHLAKYRTVQRLESSDTIRQQLIEVRLNGPGANVSGGAPIFKPGDRVKLEITNRLSPVPTTPYTPGRLLNVTVLDLASNWSIAQIYPTSGEYEPIEPGRNIAIEFEAYLPEGYEESTDILKVFATTAPLQVRWLELPPLDQPATKAGASRAAYIDPLSRAFAVLAEPITSMPAVDLPDSTPERPWAVAQMELRVRK